MEPASHTFLELRSEQRPRLLAHILGDRHGRQFGLCREFVTDFALAAVLKPRFDRGRTEPLAHFAPAFGVLTRTQFLQTGSNISLMNFGAAGEIGRASWRERVGQYGENSGGAETFKKKQRN